MQPTLKEEIQAAENGSLKQSGWKAWLSNRSKLSMGLILVLGIGVGLLIIYGAYSYWLWNYKGVSGGLFPKAGKDGLVNWEGDFKAAQDLGKDSPKTEPSPINGVLYSKESAEVFMNRRPLAIMVNNHVEARPTSSLPDADLIYEAVAEGGITRLLAIYHARDAEKVGPIRSARIYYIDWAAEFYSWFAHWGGSFVDPNDPQILNPVAGEKYICDPAADSYAYINKISIASLDQMWLGDTAYWRDTSRDVALEHTGYTGTQQLWQEAPNRYPEPGWTEYYPFEIWNFKDEAERSARPETQQVSFSFWEGYPNYDVVWEYAPADNVYLRNQGGKIYTDYETSEQIKAKTVIIQFTDEGAFWDKKDHLKYTTVGAGTGIVFMDGVASPVSWSKPSVRDRTRYYYTSTGNEVNFNRGQIWIEIVPTGMSVNY